MIKLPHTIKLKKYDEFKGLSKEDIIKKLCSDDYPINPDKIFADKFIIMDIIYKYRLKNSPIFPHYILSIAKNNVDLMYMLVVQVWKRRHKDIEEYFLKDPMYAAAYAMNCLKKRWKEAEEIIAENSCEAYKYARTFKIKLEENAHNKMLAHCLVDDRWAKRYVDFLLELQ